MDMIQTLAQELNKDPRHVENVVRLLDEGKKRKEEVDGR